MVGWGLLRCFFGEGADRVPFLARPEDIFGSVEVDGQGEIIGNFQASGTYRIVTRDGM